MTSSPDCKLWMDVLEADVLGESLPEDVRTRALRHEDQCPECKAERQAWTALATLSNEGADDAFVDRVLASLDRAKVVRPWHLWSGAGIVAVCAAAAVLVVWVRGHDVVHPAEQLVASASLGDVSGDVRLDGTPAEASSLHAFQTITTGQGRACIVVNPGVRACLDHDTELRVEDLALAMRRLDLHHGRVVASLEPQPENTSFTVSTVDGSVTAIGTAFVVDTRGGATIARVLHGVVRVHGASGDARLGAHERLDLVTGAKARSNASDEHDDEALLDGVAAVAPVPMTEAPTATTSSLAVPPPTPSSSPSPSPSDSLRTARGLRGEHRLAEAAQTYRRLESLYPDSAESHASYVSLGELQLGGLADPAGALRSYDAYLHTPGPSTRDASYGRIRALHALGRTEEEKRAITTFVAAYPSSDEAAELRDRLK